MEKLLFHYVHHGIVCEEGDDAHLAALLGTEQRVHFRHRSSLVLCLLTIVE